MSDAEAEVRRAVLDDLEALWPLIAEFYVVDHHEFDRQRIGPALVPLLTGDDHGQVWVLESGGALTGYAVVCWGWSLESGGRDCILDEIFVTTPSRGHGSRLLEAAIEGAQAQGVRAVFLETEAINQQARRFYLRHGFAAEDSIWMSRFLDR